MKATYKIAESKRENIRKTLAKYSKKATKYGGVLEAEFGESYADMIPVYTMEGENIGEELHEVFDLTITSETFSLNGFTLVAKIEHMNGGNIVTAICGSEIRPEWIKIAPFCEHCGANHGLKKTFIVRGASGDRQVGQTCLKDYCGIDPQAVGIFNELNEIYLNEEKFYDYEDRSASKVLEVVDVLALAIDTLKAHGYTKSGEQGSNKERIKNLIITNTKATFDSLVEAKQMVESISAMTAEEAVDASLGTVYGLVKAGYCKPSHLGYIAYAPLAYRNMIERKAKEAERMAVEKHSEYIGKVGERTVIEVDKCEHVTEWKSDYGTTHLYKITDMSGNIFIWYASQLFGRWVEDKNGIEDYIPYDDVNCIKCTIKDHTEYKGVKQTIVTRCKFVA